MRDGASTQLWQPAGNTRLGIVKFSLHMSVLLSLLLLVWYGFVSLEEKLEANNDIGFKTQTESHKEKLQSVQGKSFLSEQGRLSYSHDNRSVFSARRKVERHTKGKEKYIFPSFNQIWSTSVLYLLFFCMKFCCFQVIIFQSLFFFPETTFLYGLNFSSLSLMKSNQFENTSLTIFSKKTYLVEKYA